MASDGRSAHASVAAWAAALLGALLCIATFLPLTGSGETKLMAADRGGDSSEEQPDADDDHEVTPVGHASKVLLELSSSGEQNTRAYQAPRELLELARRKQAARAQMPSQAPVIRSVEDDAAPARPIGESLPPRERSTHKPVRLDSMAESSAPSISVEPASSSLEALDAFEAGLDSAESASDAAPSVARSRPSRAQSEDPAAVPAPSSASLADLVREASSPSVPSSLAAPSVPDSAAAASSRTNASPRLPLSTLAVIVGICLAIGFILAKWRGLDLLLRRH
jgi:hypothetical protein